MSHKTHILEGNNLAGRLLFRCGQSAERTNPLGVPFVGCARLDSEGQKVTCAKCIRFTRVRYGAKAAGHLACDTGAEKRQTGGTP